MRDTTFPASKVLYAFERMVEDGRYWDGPEFEWTHGGLAATTPEPHVRFSEQYRQEWNDLDPPGMEEILSSVFQAGIEQGYRDSQTEAQPWRRWYEAEQRTSRVFEAMFLRERLTNNADLTDDARSALTSRLDEIEGL